MMNTASRHVRAIGLISCLVASSSLLMACQRKAEDTAPASTNPATDGGSTMGTTPPATPGVSGAEGTTGTTGGTTGGTGSTTPGTTPGQTTPEGGTMTTPPAPSTGASS